MPQTDEERAKALGTWLGTLAWNATYALLKGSVVAVRVTLVVSFCAWISHAAVPGMAFGAWALIYLTTYTFVWPYYIFRYVRRRAAAAAAAARRGGRRRSGFMRPSRVLPPL